VTWTNALKRHSQEQQADESGKIFIAGYLPVFEME
jgi:hypothetical protein